MKVGGWLLDVIVHFIIRFSQGIRRTKAEMVKLTPEILPKKSESLMGSMGQPKRWVDNLVMELSAITRLPIYRQITEILTEKAGLPVRWGNYFYVITGSTSKLSWHNFSSFFFYLSVSTNDHYKWICVCHTLNPVQNSSI